MPSFRHYLKTKLLNESEAEGDPDGFDAAVSDLKKSIQQSNDYQQTHSDDDKFKGVDWEEQLWVASEDEVGRLSDLIGDSEAYAIFNDLVDQVDRTKPTITRSANHRRWLQSQQA